MYLFISIHTYTYMYRYLLDMQVLPYICMHMCVYVYNDWGKSTGRRVITNEAKCGSFVTQIYIHMYMYINANPIQTYVHINTSNTITIQIYTQRYISLPIQWYGNLEIHQTALNEKWGQVRLVRDVVAQRHREWHQQAAQLIVTHTRNRPHS